MFDDVFAANLFFLISGRISHVQGGKWKGTWSCPGQIQVITTRGDTGGKMFLFLSWDCGPIVKYGELEYCNLRDGAGVPPVYTMISSSKAHVVDDIKYFQLD